MPTVQQWGRRESIIWPPRGYLYTLGAFFLACVATGLFVYLRFQYGLSPLERYYLPYYLRSETAGLAHPASTYQLLYVSDGESTGRLALDADVQPGSTPQFGGKPLPLSLTPQAAKHGAYFLLREAPRSYQNKAIHAWIANWIYADTPLYNLFRAQLLFGLAAFIFQLPFSIRKDIGRIKQLRYGRRLKGPVLVNAKDFTKAVAGTGIERLRETHYDGTRGGRNFALDRQTEPLVLPSEISGLDDLRGFLKYGNHVARFSFPFIALEEKSPGFDERKMDDLIVPSTPPPVEPEAAQGNLLFPEHAVQSAGHQME